MTQKYTDRSQMIRLNTLVWLRWAAILGQSAAVIIARFVYGIQVPMGPVVAVIGLLLASNMVYWTAFPVRQRADAGHLLRVLLFDTLQLGALLALTGGLDNPFALLILAPVSIGAAALPYRSALAVAILGMAVVSGVWAFSLPLVDASGAALRPPDMLRFGMWLALVVGIVFNGFYAWRVASEIHMMQAALVATQEALAREQKLTDLTGVVAATAHELGTPFATIKLISSELTDLLEGQPELQDDAREITTQINRCRDILHAMGQAATPDSIMDHAPVQAIVEEAARPHINRGILVRVSLGAPAMDQPHIPRRPEILHGLRNLIQNAVDYARSEVDVRINWSDTLLTIAVMDDGPGFPAHLLTRLGEPIARSVRKMDRTGYDGMGMGLFISNTLLGRTGAQLAFSNRAAGQGAIVEVKWQRGDLNAPVV